MDEQMIEPCPFCGWQAHGGLRTDRGLTLRHDGKGCALTGLWFQVDLWNHRAAHGVMAGKVAELEGELKEAWLLLHQARHHVVFAVDVDPNAADLANSIDAALAPYPERRSERHE